MRKTSVRYAIVLLTGEVTGKNVTGTIIVRRITLKLRGYPYILCFEVVSLLNM